MQCGGVYVAHFVETGLQGMVQGLAAHPLAGMARVVRFMDEHPYERMLRRRAGRLARNARLNRSGFVGGS